MSDGEREFATPAPVPDATGLAAVLSALGSIPRARNGSKRKCGVFLR